MSGRTHGIYPTYVHGCRCRPCTDAWAVYTRNRQIERSRQIPAHIEHGKTTTYQNYRCRCDGCKKAHTDAHRAWRIKRRVNRSHADRERPTRNGIR